MRKTKFIALALALALVLTAFTGCMGVSMDTSIKEDGSGTVLMKVGYSAEFLEQMKSLGGESEDEDTNEEELKDIVIGGKTYKGAEESFDFSDVEELNNFFNGDSSAFGEDGTAGENETFSSVTQAFSEYGVTKFERTEDGHFILLMNNRSVGEETTDAENDSQMEELMEDMVVEMSFNFPEEVKQVKGPADGVTISGKTLKLDGFKMSTAEDAQYAFVTGGAALDEQKFSDFVKSSNESIEAAKEALDELSDDAANAVSFSDVEEGRWFYEAVNNMAGLGYVKGYPDGTFLPLGEISYAEFASILSNMAEFEHYDGQEYWAYDAIRGCIDAGYFESLGEKIDSATYGVPISREVAIAAMERYVSATSVTIQGMVDEDAIPDYAEIDDAYKTDIRKAYLMGITKGKDDSGTFVPKATLTRAEVCQLFMNVL